MIDNFKKVQTKRRQDSADITARQGWGEVQVLVHIYEYLMYVIHVSKIQVLVLVFGQRDLVNFKYFQILR